MQAIGRQPQRAPDGAPVHYERHRPEQTTLYRLVQQHAATFFAEAEGAAGADLPQFVKDEFESFLECGILAHGFLRLRCRDRGHDKLVAFSCKRRGFCPSCGVRRMAQTAAHMVDHVIPHVPVRQWVLSLLDGTVRLVTSSLEFMQRLVDLVPRPRLHLIHFHGVLTPNAKLRAMAVPQGPEEGAPAAKPAECELSCARHREVRLSWAPLLKRVFEPDLEHCPNCGGEFVIVAVILEQPVTEKIFTHPGLQARARPRSPARGQALQAA